jgi:hypothetical protein
MGYTQAIFHLYYDASLFSIPFTIFHIIENGLLWSNSQKINHHALIFFDILINGVADYFALTVVLRVYFPGKTILFRARS